MGRLGDGLALTGGHIDSKKSGTGITLKTYRGQNYTLRPGLLKWRQISRIILCRRAEIKEERSAR